MQNSSQCYKSSYINSMQIVKDHIARTTFHGRKMKMAVRMVRLPVIVFLKVLLIRLFKFL